MNTDRRRILGPQDARIPDLGISTNANNSMDIDPAGFAAEKRSSDIQKMFMKTNFISNANGSSYIEHGDTIVQVSVFGPRPIKSSFIEQASFSVECRFLPHLKQDDALDIDGDHHSNPNGRTGLSYTEHKISSFVESCLVPSILLDKYPKSTIDLHITVIEHNSESTSLTNLVNWITVASSLALVDSGVEVRDIVTAGHIISDGQHVILDPIEPVSKRTDCLVCFMNLKNEIVGIWVDGDLDNLDTAIEECNKMSRTIRGNINSYLLST
ncbi:3'-5'-exoribonuclease [Yamadazyma tenuis]|uniref:Exoribonuclease phosphorolytic domain-containing protein n=1 Tax=Candida tenuis (strain ATCC 10573 / BCRC 21748 / CBS 615 / JCM 9827 / NBRC 10315 / NRRL Y-1498 / VKM Y-70) TaxID=590646 RepID=G3B4B4_CANTC|nr:uncharacterized protein CANTEDRAFT_105628 [Yamadazyma tenuis ATCC 10573]EGV63940.1 hypothetical protein CANTEDRAFT_105628 [Yamadazyma tenuis ATCC 10573]WEJ96445.1 3'-5'-exoribonuclease [Yamadazyma tenuis]